MRQTNIVLLKSRQVGKSLTNIKLFEYQKYILRIENRKRFIEKIFNI